MLRINNQIDAELREDALRGASFEKLLSNSLEELAGREVLFLLIAWFSAVNYAVCVLGFQAVFSTKRLTNLLLGYIMKLFDG